jgi:hypothetical protein
MEKPLIVDAASIKATRQKLENPDRTQEAIADIKKMIGIKQTLQWRADAGTCCGSLCNVTASLSREIGIMEKALNALEKGDKPEAIRALEEYERVLKSQNEPGKPGVCQ